MTKAKVDLEAITNVGRFKLTAGHEKFDDQRKKVYLETLRKTSNKTIAARAAGVAQNTVSNHYHKYPEFAKAVDQCFDEAVDMMEHEVLRRGFLGVPKGVYYQGAKIGEEMQYSDTLALETLRALRPEKWQRNTNINLKGEVNVNVSEARSKLATLLGVKMEEIEDGEVIE